MNNHEKEITNQNEKNGESTEMTEENFSEMIEQSIQKAQDFDEGDVVEGEVVKITDSYIFISYGGKNDAYAEIADYQEKDGSIKYKVGDKIKGYIVKKSDSETIISKSLSKAHVSDYILSDAHEKKIPVSGKVVSMVKGGFSIDLLGARAFCPMSQMDSKPIADTNNYLGKTFDFEIIDYQDRGRNVVVSRRVLLEKTMKEAKEETLSKIEPGSVIKGVVTRLTNFGAFVDIGGIEGLVHISKISWEKIESPGEVLSLGQEIEVKVLEIKKDKISLSIKDLLEDPFDSLTKDLEEGMVVKGKVVSNEAFGSFVELAPGVTALIPISEMARGRRISKPSEIVNVGDIVEAQIIKFDPEKKKISLSLKSLQPDPWDNINDIVAENDIITGTIENVNKFGLFIKIADGVTGLLPKSKLRFAKEKIEEIGKEIEVKVAQIDYDNKRISLEPSEMIEQPAQTERENKPRRRNAGREESWKKYASQKATFDSDSPFKDL